MRAVLCSVLLLLLGSAVAVPQSAVNRVVDPFFFIEYDPANVHFDHIPKLIGERCTQLRNYYVEGWVYGHLKTHEAEYFIVDGLVKIESQQPHGQPSVIQDDGFGYIVEIRPGECLVDPTSYIFFPELNKGVKPRVHTDDALLNTISAELLDRYTRTFGGKEVFLRRIQNVSREKLPESLRRQLKSF
jgi:hypothetical protein